MHLLLGVFSSSGCGQLSSITPLPILHHKATPRSHHATDCVGPLEQITDDLLPILALIGGGGVSVTTPSTEDTRFREQDGTDTGLSPGHHTAAITS